MLDDFSLAKSQKILKSADFNRVKSKGNRCSSKHFILLTLCNTFENSRMGLIVSKKVGNAVVRNRWKRYLREFFRLNGKMFKESMDFVFIVKGGFEKPNDFDSISKELSVLLKKVK